MRSPSKGVAINIDDASIPDNQGSQPGICLLSQEEPAAYFSTLPIKAMAEAIRRAGIPSSVSNSAGTFVCNHTMWHPALYCPEQLPIKAGLFTFPTCLNRRCI